MPPGRIERYRPHAGAGTLLFGLRPEHITERRSSIEANQHPFDATIDVTEPMGMETMVHFRVNGAAVCARVNPAARAEGGRPMTLVADMNHMHLIDGASGKVL